MPSTYTKEDFVLILRHQLATRFPLAKDAHERNEIASDIMGFILVNANAFIYHFRTFALFTVIKHKCDEFLQDPNASDSLREICSSLLAKLDAASG